VRALFTGITAWLKCTGSDASALPHIQGGPKKRGHRLLTVILSKLSDLRSVFAGRFLGKFAVKLMLKIPPHLAYVATLPCETLMSAKQAVNDKLQGSAATYLRRGGAVNNQIGAPPN